MVQGQHEGPHDVRDPVPHGSRRLHHEPRGPDGDGQRVRRREHAPHDPRGTGRRAAHAERRRLRRRPALDGRSVARSPPHSPLPRREAHLEHRLRLRRERAARQEMPCAADRLVASASGGLARRAHAHHRRRRSGGPRHVSGGGDAERIRQDEPLDGGVEPPRVAGVDHRRRHRVDARRSERSAPSRQSRATTRPKAARHRRGAGRRDRPTVW